MDPIVERRVNTYLGELAGRLDLDREARIDVVEELRAHLLDAVDGHLAHGHGPSESVELALGAMGPSGRLASEFAHVHAGRDTRDALLCAGLPVAGALVLRWIAFDAGGSTLGWPRLLSPAAFLALAAAILVLPALHFARARYAVAAWSAIWLISVIFVTLG